MDGVTASLNPPRHGEGDHAQRGGGGVPNLRRPEVYVARKLRRAMSLPEVLVWQRLKNEQTGVRFRKQHPIGSFVVDFYCAATRTVIEIDGEVHNRADRPARDADRDRFLTENGYRVIHIPAADILRDADRATDALAALVASPLHRPADGSPPRAGEDL